MTAGPSGNPFVVYRERLDSYRHWVDEGGTDAGFVEVVERLDAAVASVEGRSGGHGFQVTPVTAEPELASAVGLSATNRLWVKDETNNVSGSHKARHLFGLALHAAVDAEFSEAPEGELVIASCGNAALGAAVVAKAIERDLRVFVPVWADESVVQILEALEARIERCERRDGEAGDPCYLRFRESVADGSVPFSVQGSDVPRTLDGGRTIGWELADQLSLEAGGPGRLDRIYVQVGGGALGACLAAGLADGVAAGSIQSVPILHGVQTVAAAPLERAWWRLMAEDDPRAILEDATSLDHYMWPWELVGETVASGIVDDVTYDWVPLAKAMIDTGGGPIVVGEADVSLALALGRRHTGIDVDATGTAGLAGLLFDPSVVGKQEEVAVLFTGHRR